jgi:hypothetical protein
MIYRPTSSRRENIATDAFFTLTVTAILGVILFSSYPYVQLTYDSHDYIAASTNAGIYLNGKNPDGFYYLIRPPFMPLYLHLFDDMIFAGALLNTFAFGITIFTCLRLGRLFIYDRVTIWIFILSVIFSFSFLQFHFFLWTEAAFAAIILVVFYCIATEKPVYQVIALLILAFLLRKAAGFITFATLAVYVNDQKIKQAVLISIAMAAVFFAWEVFAFSQIDTYATGNTWGHHISFARIPHLDSVTSWILPRVLPVAARVLLMIVILTAIYIGRAAFIGYWRDQKNRSLFFFWFAYISSLFIFWGARDFDEADRGLAVVLPFFMLTCFSLFSRLGNIQISRQNLYFLPILWLIYPISKCVYHLLTIHSQ